MPMTIFYLLLAISGVSFVVLLALRLLDWRAEQQEWERLSDLQPKKPARYDPKMVADLPEPAQRFFNFAITPGTPLVPVVEIRMGGQFSLGARDRPNYQTMEASQILASPHGFIWRLQLSGRLPLSGFDTGRWTRFRAFGLFPVVRTGDDADHAKSAYGRQIAESVFWAPAAVLPGPGVVWDDIDSTTACVTVSRESLSQTVNVKVGADGRPVEVSFLRWSNANPDRVYRFQPFGGTLSDFHEVQGYRLPFKVTAGNMFRSDDYFAFYRAEVSEIRFPGLG